MGEFRPHTLEEKRKLRSARQKRKRKQKTAKKHDEERLKTLKAVEEQKQLTAKQRDAAREFYRKWRAKCEENKKMKDLLVRNQRKVRATKFLIYAVQLVLGSEIHLELDKFVCIEKFITTLLPTNQ